MKKSKKRILGFLLFLVLLFAECNICIGTAESAKNQIEYDLLSEYTPLELQQLSVKNCGADVEGFTLFEGELLYEIELTFFNTSSVTVRGVGDLLEFRGSEGALYKVGKAEDYPLNFEERYSQVIPAGSTGSIRVYLAVPKEEQILFLEQKAKKLDGTPTESLSFSRSQEVGETTVWRFTD